MTEAQNGIGTRVAEGILGRIRDVVSVERVVGEPIERDGIVLIPVASIRAGGGGGGGSGGDEKSTGSGEGGGFGADARPVGAYVMQDGDVRWKPAIDVNRLVVIGNLTAMAYFFVWLTARARR